MLTIKTPAEGEWFLPSHSDAAVPGVLRVEEGQILLTLLGRLPRIWESVISGLNPEAIWGVTSAGIPITLLHCTSSGGRGMIGSPRAATFTSSLILWGIHRKSAIDAIPVELSVRFSNLENWLGHTRAHTRALADFESASLGELRRPILSLQQRLVSTDELEIDVVFRTCWTSSDRRLEAEDKGAIVFRSPKGVPLLEYLPLVRIFRSFLTLAMSSQVYMSEVTAIFVEPVVSGDQSVGRRAPIPITGIDIPIKSEAPEVSVRRFLFDLPALDDHATEFITRWYQQFEILAPALNLYTFTKNRDDLAVEETFLNVVKACEYLHRATEHLHCATLEDNSQAEEHAARITEIFQACPEQHKKWFKKKLPLLRREPNLQQRLTELTRLVGDDVMKLLPVKADTLVEKTVVGRNYLTHFSEEARRTSPGISLLPSLERWWFLIFEASLLLKTGLPQNSVKDIFLRNREMNFERFCEMRDLSYTEC